jgi:putative DNA primase/helicase
MVFNETSGEVVTLSPPIEDGNKVEPRETVPRSFLVDGSASYLEVDNGSPDSSDLLAIIQHLATLSPFDYDLVREIEADRLGVRISYLDEEVERIRQGQSTNSLLPPEPEPWPDPVNGAEILSEISTILHRYLVLTDAQATAIAIWIAHAHAHDAATISPRLSIASPVKRCGKTTLLSVVQTLVPRALSTSNITPAAVFRVIEAIKPTLLIDEADTFLRGSDDLRGILNGGHNRALARVIRIAGENLEPMVFNIWAPVAIAMIGRLPSTLADRSIEIELRRKRKEEVCERFRSDRIDHFVILRRKMARWAADHIDNLRNADPEVPEELHDRAADNWRPLLAIADEAGDPWPQLARTAAIALTRTDTDDAPGIRLLEDIRALSITAPNRTSGIFTKDLLQALHANEQRPWATWTRGRPITPHQLSRLLGPFGIPSPRTIRIGHKTGKGYRFDDFADAFSRYLPTLTVTSTQAANSLDFDRHSTLREINGGIGSGGTDLLDCHGVTDLDADDGRGARPAPDASRSQARTVSRTTSSRQVGIDRSSNATQTRGQPSQASMIANVPIEPAPAKFKFGWVRRLFADGA